MIKTYYRAQSIEDALRYQMRPEVKTALLTGYDAILAEDVEAVVDLQAVPLKTINVGGETVSAQSLVTLQMLVDHTDVPTWLRTLAREEEPSTLRNMRTLAGVIFDASPESLLLAGLLAAGTHVTVQSLSGSSTVPLADFIAGYGAKGAFPIALETPLNTQVATAKVGRTPADKPIVAAAACRTADGVRLALCGVASTPILVSPDAVETLDPVGDFRGSAQYRRSMAAVLSQRVLAQV